MCLEAMAIHEQQSIQRRVGRFVEERPVMRDHDLPERVVALMRGEIDELLDEMQWGKREPTPEEIEKVRLELADVVWYCMSLGNLLGFDVEQAVKDKIVINERRFPSHLFQGDGDFETIYQARKRELGEMIS